MVTDAFKYLVDGLILEGHITLLLGRPGRGKSWLALAIAVAVASGMKCLGKFLTTRASVILIDEDTPTSVLEWRIRRMCAYFKIDPNQLPLEVISMQGWRLDNRLDLEITVGVAKALSQPVLLVIDCLDSVLQKLDTNKTRDSSIVGQLLGKAKSAGMTVLVVHHMSLKGPDDSQLWNTEQDFTKLSMGNTKLVAFSDTALGMWQASENPTIFVVRSKARRIPLSVPPVFAVRLVEDSQKTYAHLQFEEKLPVLPSGNARMISKLFRLNTTSKYTVKQIMTETGEFLSAPELRLVLDELRRNGVLRLWREAHNLYVYGLDPGFRTLKNDYYTDAIKNESKE